MEAATEPLSAALGPAVPRAELPGAWALAAAALRAGEAGAIDADGLIVRGGAPAGAAALRVGRPGATSRRANAGAAR